MRVQTTSAQSRWSSTSLSLSLVRRKTAAGKGVCSGREGRGKVFILPAYFQFLPNSVPEKRKLETLLLGSALGNGRNNDSAFMTTLPEKQN